VPKAPARPTVRAAHDVLRFAVSWAVYQQWLAVDVLAGAGGAPSSTPRSQVLVSTVRAVVAEARKDVRCAEEQYARCRWSPAAELTMFRAQQRLLLVYLVADTGLRRGELTGLRSDDLLGRELWIERAVTSGPRGGTVLGPTKSHRHGRLTVTSATAPCQTRPSSCLARPQRRSRGPVRVAVHSRARGEPTYIDAHPGRPVRRGAGAGRLRQRNAARGAAHGSGPRWPVPGSSRQHSSGFATAQ
jgi:integrase